MCVVARSSCCEAMESSSVSGSVGRASAGVVVITRMKSVPSDDGVREPHNTGESRRKKTALRGNNMMILKRSEYVHKRRRPIVALFHCHDRLL